MKTTYKVISALLAAIMLLLVVPFSAFAVDGGKITVSSASAKKGEEVSLNVSFDVNPGIVSATFSVDYDPAKLKLKRIDDCGKFGSFLHNAEGNTLSWQNPTAENFTETGVYAILVFDVLDAGESNVSLSYIDDNVFDKGFNNVAFNVTSGKVTALDNGESHATYDLYVSETGSSSNTGLSAASPFLYFEDACNYIKNNEATIGDKTITVHLSGEVSTGSAASSSVGIECTDNLIIVTSTDNSSKDAYGTLMMNSPSTGTAVCMRNNYRFVDVNFRVMTENVRDMYLCGHDFIVEETADFESQNSGYSNMFAISGGSTSSGAECKDFSIVLNAGKWASCGLCNAWGGSVSGDISLKVGGYAYVSTVYGVTSSVDASSTAALRTEGSSIIANITIEFGGNCHVPLFYGSFGSSLGSRTLYGNINTSVKDKAAVDTFYGAGYAGTVSGSVTNTIYGGTIQTFCGGFYGGDGSSYYFNAVKGNIYNTFYEGCHIVNNAFMGSNGGGTELLEGTIVEGNISTVINGGVFDKFVYGAGYYVPTKGNVSLVVNGDTDESKIGTKNKTSIAYSLGKDGGALYGAGQASSARVQGKVVLSLNGGYINSSVYAGGNSGVTGDITVNVNGALVKNYDKLGGRGIVAGTSSSGATVFGNVTVNYSAGNASRLILSGSSGIVTGDATVNLSGGSLDNLTFAPSESAYVSGKRIVNLDLSQNDITVSKGALECDKIIGGSGVLTISSDYYVTANTLTGNLSMQVNGEAKSGEVLVIKQAIDESRVSIGNTDPTAYKYSCTGSRTAWGHGDYAAVINNYLYVDDKIAMVYEYNASDIERIGATKVSYSFDGEKYEDTELFKSDDDYYAAIIPAVAAKNFGDSIYVKVENVATPDVYSIAQACNRALAPDVQADEDYKNLAKAILNYGKAAQEYFGYRTEYPIIDSYFSFPKVKFFDTHDLGDLKDKKVQILGTSILLKDNIVIKFWMTINGLDPEDLTVNIDGKDVNTSIVKNGQYYTVSCDVSCKNIDKNVSIKIKNGNDVVSNVYSDSVTSYCAQAMDTSDEKLIDMCNYIASYVYYVDIYFGINPSVQQDTAITGGSETEIIIRGGGSQTVESEYDDPDFNPLDPECFTPKDDPTQFEESIAKYEKAKPADNQNKVLFYGSSLFTRWDSSFGNYNNPNLADAILDSTGNKVALNHGFGSSTMYDLCYFYNRMVKAYKPKVLVITSFLNDKTAGYTNDEMLKLTAWLCKQARADMPGIKIFITDYRPTTSAKTNAQIQDYQKLNSMLKDYASYYEDTKILELSKDPIYYTSPEYCGTYTHINEANFVDNVHFTRDAYIEFGQHMREYLRDVLFEDLGYTLEDIEFLSPYNLKGELDKEVTAISNSYKAADEGKIIFCGNSHYNRWRTSYDNNTAWPNDATKMNLEDQVVGASGTKLCLNHGFGSSCLHDICNDYENLILKWKPSAVVITTYVNDYPYTADDILKLAEWLIQRISWDLPNCKIFFTDYPPLARDRSDIMTKIKSINGGLQTLANKYANLSIIELSKDARFYTDAQYAGTYTHVNKDLFVSDEIHWRPNGYAILADIYIDVLTKAGLLY